MTPGKREGPATTPDLRQVAPATPVRVADSSTVSRPGVMTARACQAPGCDRELTGQRRRFCCDLCRVRGQRAERVTENGEFGKAAIRMIAALARRVGGSDIAQFGALWEVRGAADQAAVDAIDGLRSKGFSWGSLAAEAGMSRQALCQWYQRRLARSGVNDPLTPGSRSPGGWS
jgi:hypothetical protein